MRQATPEDIPALVEMGRRCHAEKQDRYPFVERDCEAFFASVIKDGVVLVHGRGFICGVISGQPSNVSYRTAYEIFWWSEDRGGARLLAGFEKWAKDEGCDEIAVSHPTSERAVGRYLRRWGYRPEASVVRKGI